MTKSPPLVSIGMVVYNGAQFLHEALYSLLSQTYPHFELIISDNASTDNTQNICKEFKKKDKRIRYIRQSKNMGAVNNFNYVLQQSKGEYFMWAAHDDIWNKKYIEFLINILEKNKKAVLAVSDYTVFNKKHKNRIILPLKKGENKIKAATFLHFNHLETFVYGLFRASILKKIGGFHNENRFSYKFGSDYLTIFKMLLYGDIYHTKKMLFFKRDTGNYIDRYDTLIKLHFDKNLIFKIKRYSIYYLINYYDVFYIAKYTLLSRLAIKTKIKVILADVRKIFMLNFEFFSSIIMGALAVLKGLLFLSKK